MERVIDQRSLAVLKQVQDERFTIKTCSKCSGPQIFSKIKPLARCFGCGVMAELTKVATVSRRWKCSTCRKFFHAVLGTDSCPACQKAGKTKAARECRLLDEGWSLESIRGQAKSV